MKQTLSILLIITTLLTLCACGIKNTGSEISSAESRFSDSSIPSIIMQEVESAEESESNISSTPVIETSSSNITSSQIASSKNSSVDKQEVTVVEPLHYHPTINRYYDYEDFIESINYSRKKRDTPPTFLDNKNLREYDCLDMLLNEEKILLVEPLKKYQLDYIYTDKRQLDSYNLRLVCGKDNKKKIIEVELFPITNREELNKDLLSLIKSKVENANPSKKAKTCKWGEYYIENKGATAYLRYDDYLICVSMLSYKHDYKTFKEECFKHFNFKYYPLAKVGYRARGEREFFISIKAFGYGLQNEPLYEWLSEQHYVLVATAKKGSVIGHQKRFFKAEYLVHIGKDEETELTVGFIPIEKEANLLTLAKQDARPDVELVKGEQESIWGEYYVEKGSPTAYFRYDDYLIRLHLPNVKEGTQFDTKYFDYFELKYLSLSKWEYVEP